MYMVEEREVQHECIYMMEAKEELDDEADDEADQGKPIGGRNKRGFPGRQTKQRRKARRGTTPRSGEAFEARSQRRLEVELEKNGRTCSCPPWENHGRECRKERREAFALKQEVDSIEVDFERQPTPGSPT